MRNRKNVIAAAILAGFGWIVGCDSSDNFSGTGVTRHPASTQPMAVAGDQGSIAFNFDGPMQADGLPFPWKCKVIRGKLGIAETTVPELGGHRALEVNCVDSHFIVYNESMPFEAKNFPVLSWEWKAEILPKGGDVRTHEAFYYSSGNRNDKVLQMLVGFEGDKVINYSWDTTAPIGTCVDEWSPAAKIKTYVIESGASHLGGWHQYKVNIFSDYQKLFGGTPGKVMGVSVQTNSNHTSSDSKGLVGGITVSRLRS